MMVIVPRDQGESVLQALVVAGHTATFTESRSGVLRQAQLSLFIGVEDENLAQVLAIVEDSCHSDVLVGTGAPSQGSGAGGTRVGGAVVFVWDLDRFEIF
jgi:uncharacterized protein YaaQ